MRHWRVVVIAAALGCRENPPKETSQLPARAGDAAVAVAMDAAIAIQLRPVEVFSVGESPLAIAVAGSTLVWTDAAGSLWSMPSRGGATRELSNQQQEGRPIYRNLIALGADVIAALPASTYDGDGDLVRVQLPQGPLAKLNLRFGNDTPLELASDGNAIYVNMANSPTIFKVTPDGKRAALVDHARSGIDVEGDTLYSVSYTKGTLIAVKTAGGKPRTIARGLPKPTGFAVDADAAYVWCEGDKALRRIELKTGTTKTIATTGLDNSDTLVDDGDWIYTVTWLGADASQLVRVAKDGSQMQLLADKLGAPYDIAIDAEAVFLTVRDQNTIIRLDKAALKPL